MTFLGRFKTHDNPHSGMIQRCSERVAATHDAGFIVTDAAAKVMAQAKFPSNHSASCDCGESGGRMKPADCKQMHIADGDGKKIASFDVREFGAARDSEQNIIVYRRPTSQTQDAKKKFSLGDLNRLNREHYGHTEQDEHGNLNNPSENFYRRENP
jgi:hypothetical protein